MAIRQGKQKKYPYICNVLRNLGPFATNFKNVKNTHGGVLLLVKLQAISLPPENRKTYGLLTTLWFFVFLGQRTATLLKVLHLHYKLTFDQIKFNSDFRNILQLTELRISGFTLFSSPIAQGRKVFKILSSVKEGVKRVWTSEIVLLEEKNQSYMLLVQLKELCKISKGVSSIFVVGDTLTLVLDTIFREMYLFLLTIITATSYLNMVF